MTSNENGKSANKKVILESAIEAINQYKQGKEVTTVCPICGEVIEVGVVEAVNSYWVDCPNKHVQIHIQGNTSDTPAND